MIRSALCLLARAFRRVGEAAVKALTTTLRLPLTTKSELEIAFVRLTEISAHEIVEHMRAPRVTAHMPLAATSCWDLRACEDFVKAKEERWDRDGLGHWGILCNGAYAGWGGFQKEGNEWDFGLVLNPNRFGTFCLARSLAL